MRQAEPNEERQLFEKSKRAWGAYLHWKYSPKDNRQWIVEGLDDETRRVIRVFMEGLR